MLTISSEQPFTKAVTTAPARNGSVDLLRFAGAIGIILFHCGAAGSAIGLAALPVFVTLLVFYGAGRSIEHQAKRLLVPWLAWSGIYAALKIAQSLVTGTPLAEEFAPWMLLTGASLHLWFLSFSFLFLALCAAITDRIQTALLWPACIVASGTALWLCNTATLQVPFAQWLSVVPAACTGLLMQRTQNKALPPMFLAFGCLAAFAFGYRDTTGQLVMAGLAIAFVFIVPMRQTSASDFLSDVSFGMYLVHPALIAALLYIVPIDSPMLFPLAVAGSLAATLALKKVLPASV